VSLSLYLLLSNRKIGEDAALHELSIAQNLIEVATTAAASAHAIRVSAVVLKLGALSGVAKDALLFGYDIASAGTLLEGSRLEIEEVPATVFCTQCQAERILDDIQDFRCPVCGTPTSQIVRGREIELVSLTVED